MRRLLAAALAAVLSWTALAQGDPARASESQPIAIGETFTIESKMLGERRRINVMS